MLESYLQERLKQKDILLMTHIVIGYPSMEESMRLVAAMVEAGVDLMELQIPFSEPIADGPVILAANQKALAGGVTVKDCLAFAAQASSRFPIPFLIMSYYNILFKYGAASFVNRMADLSIKGAIVPDLPPEEGQEYVQAMADKGLAPIFIFSPTTSDERMRYINSHASGFVYCVARKGVTGADTAFSEQLDTYLARCRQATDLPLALGFGVKSARDVQYLRNKVDIAVVGTQTIRLMDRGGRGAVKDFIGELAGP